MIEKAFLTRDRVSDYLYHLEAMTRKEAKRLWRDSIKNAWNNQCAYCGEPPIDDKSLTVDHVKPKSKGGEDRTNNCVPACAKCNHSKGSEDWVEWFSRQSFYSLDKQNIIQTWLDHGVVKKQNRVVTSILDMSDSKDLGSLEAA